MLLVDQVGGHSHSHAPDNIRLGKHVFFQFFIDHVFLLKFFFPSYIKVFYN